MKPSSNACAGSAKTLKAALSQVSCSSGLARAIRAGDVAVIDLNAPDLTVADPKATAKDQAPSKPAHKPR